MNKTRVIIAFTAGLLASTAATAADTNLSQLLGASIATLPAASGTSTLQPATEAAIRRQIDQIDARMTAALATPAAPSTPATATTELASR